MKFHSDLFGWEYVWRNFADENGGSAVTESGEEDGKLLHLSVPIEGTAFKVLFTPEKPHGKKMSGAHVLAVYSAADSFAFSIFQEKAHHQLGKALGMQDLQVHDAAFDSKFMIQGTKAKWVEDLFKSAELREMILLQPPSILHIDTKVSKNHPNLALPERAKAVVYHFEGTMDKLHQLQGAYDIVVDILRGLSEIGAVKGFAAAEVEIEHEAVGEAEPQAKRLRSPLLDR